MAHFILVRHAAPAIDSALPAEAWGLKADGERAARRLAALPVLRDIEGFVSSPEPKALGTARAIAGGRLVSVDDGLRELDRSGLPWYDSDEAYEGVVAAILSHPGESIEGCETAAGARRRVTDAVLRYAPGTSPPTVAFVTHGIALTLCISRLLGRGPDLDLWRRLAMPDVAVVDTAAKTVRCASWSQLPSLHRPG